MTHCKIYQNPYELSCQTYCRLWRSFAWCFGLSNLLESSFISLSPSRHTFSIHLLIQFMHKPTCVHLQEAKRVLRYLSGTSDKVILLTSSSSASLTRRYTSGFWFMLGHSPISWKIKRQNVVASSTTKDEYRSIPLTVCEVFWLKQLLKDSVLPHIGTIPVICDNIWSCSSYFRKLNAPW